MMDCRKMPSDKNCDLVMTGSGEHILPAAVAHAVANHGHQDTPDLHEEIKKSLEDVPAGQ